MPLAGSPLRALKWKRPARVRFPTLIEQGIARSCADVPNRHSNLGRLLSGAPVYRPDGAERRRSLRSEGATNIATLMSAVLANTDIGSGQVLVPRADSRWQRRSWADIDFRAYGEEVPDERSLRRTERHVRELKDLGLIEVCEWRKVGRDGAVRSIVAIKRFTELFWRLLALEKALARERRERDRARKKAALSKKLERENADPTDTRGSVRPTKGAEVVPLPRSGAPPPRTNAPTATGMAALAEMLKQLRS